MNLEDLVKMASEMSDEELAERLDEIRKSRVVRGVRKAKKESIDDLKKRPYFDTTIKFEDDEGEEIELEL